MGPSDNDTASRTVSMESRDVDPSESKIHKYVVDKDTLIQTAQLLRKFSYTLVSYVDRGSTAMVYKVTNMNGETRAAKVIDHRKLSPLILQYFLPNELKITKNLHHPYIVAVDRVHVTTDYSIMIAEFACDGDLISVIEKCTKPNVLQSRIWFVQIVYALVYLHAQGNSSSIDIVVFQTESSGIAHRDIKADNVLLFSGVAKLSDFGYAQYSLDREGQPVMCTTFCGTLEYKAPETLLCNAPFDPFIADCFSLGVLLFTLVTLEFPFGCGPELRSNNGLLRLHRDIQRKRYHHISHEIRNDRKLMSLVKQLLNPDTLERITAKQTLAHQWLQEVAAKYVPTQQSDIDQSMFINDNKSCSKRREKIDSKSS